MNSIRDSYTMIYVLYVVQKRLCKQKYVWKYDNSVDNPTQPPGKEGIGWIKVLKGANGNNFFTTEKKNCEGYTNELIKSKYTSAYFHFMS